MKYNDLITRREVELMLLEKGQKSKRYKSGEIWELNFDEIREALSEYQPEIVRCKDCKYWRTNTEFCMRWSVANVAHHTAPDWFCADGVKLE